MEKITIEKIIESGNLAPSGSNSQPWRFVVQGDTIRIIALPERDHRILNFRNRGTFVAHGALIENMTIAARHFGYETTIVAFPDGNSYCELSFRPLFEKHGRADMFGAIQQRHTNRRPYKKEPLIDEEKKFLFTDAQHYPSCELALVEGSFTHTVARNLAMDIAVTLKHPLLHRLLFEEILWKEEHQKDRKGLYVKTMEVVPPKSTIFKLMSDWKKTQFLGKLRIPEKIYDENVKTIGSSALIGVIAVKDDDMAFFDVGKMLENIWLRATMSGLQLQIVTGILFLWQYANLGNDEIFSPTERNIIDRAYEHLRNIFQTENGVLAIAFRIGRAKAPSAVSFKRPPEIRWE